VGGVLALLVVIGAAVALTDSGTPRATGTTPSPSANPPPSVSPSPNPSVLQCRAALREIRRFDRKATDAYKEGNDVTDAPDAQRIRIYRNIGATLFAIEVELATLDVPDELVTIYELERQFVEETRMAYEQGAVAIQAGDVNESTDADIQQLVARGTELHDVVYDRIQAFEPRTCA